MRKLTLAKLDCPILLAPKPEPRVWGGRRIAELFGRELADGPVGESWEVHGELQVSQGPWAGRTLDSLVSEFGTELLGQRGNPTESFPLLTKWLDCREWLSVQVHPDDLLARELTGLPTERGKSEAWYVAHTDPGATLIHGLRDGASPGQLDELQGEAVLELMRQLSPEPGTLLFTGAGTVHALGPGFLIYEVQQSSDLTYRLYDWGRDRPIHPDQSRRCMTEALPTPSVSDEQGLRCRYFEIEVLDHAKEWKLDGETFSILAAVQGPWRLQGDFESIDLAFGDTALLPANLGTVRVDRAGSAADAGRLLIIGLGDGKS